MPPRRPDRPTVVLLALAALWAAGLVVAALVVPAYGGTAVWSSTSGPTVHVATSSTLVGENGAKALVPVGLPLVAVGVVAASLWRRRRRGRPGAGPLAWTAAGLLGLVTFLGMLTVGPFVLPVALLVLVACGRAAEAG